ncbi:MAG: glutamate-5-semialdehyde dehydrogenase [Bacteroidales bacterium]|nr:glutamate-5-semialdehyde dehydrogenase [Bacteroidales bacterium]
MTLQDRFQAVKKAAKELQKLNDSDINQILLALAESAIDNTAYIISENKKDLERMDPTDPKYDRLMLTPERIKSIASDMKKVASLPSPLGVELFHKELDNGLLLRKVSVPFGVIGIIYEARPNVSFDVFSLCLKSGSACVLKGSSDAQYSNQAIVKVIHEVLHKLNYTGDIIELLPSDRAATQELLKAKEYVDLLIPRGSAGLIKFVRENATIPVIETGIGVCHTYFDEFGDLDKAIAIVTNAKTRRVSVCNALECLIIHKNRLDELPALCKNLSESQVILYADEAAKDILTNKYPTKLLKDITKESYGTEFLDYKLAIKTVENIDEAIDHIDRYGSKHSECIITENDEKGEYFQQMVDAACVYRNASTAFTDGAQFGLGAEIGISTQKLHARGPMALAEITSYKWLINGEGQIRVP